MSNDGAFQYAYGLYILGGGTPNGFYDLTIDDVQTILSVHKADQAHQREALVRDISKMFGSGRDTHGT